MFFWNILSRIYCYLIINNIISIKPNFLFNKPRFKLSCAYKDYIYADTSFTKNERILLKNAVSDIEYFCNGLIKLNIIYEDHTDNCNILIKAEEDHPSIIKSDNEFDCNTLGLCEWMTDNTRRLCLVYKRLSNNITFTTTATHELGHFLGMSHTDIPSIMYKYNMYKVPYLTLIDAKAFASIWNIDFRMLRYLKLD